MLRPSLTLTTLLNPLNKVANRVFPPDGFWLFSRVISGFCALFCGSVAFREFRFGRPDGWLLYGTIAAAFVLLAAYGDVVGNCLVGWFWTWTADIQKAGAIIRAD